MAWQYSTSFSAGSGSSITLPVSHPIRAEDVLGLFVLHGNQQTLEFLLNVDFTIDPEANSIAWTDLPVQDGDTIFVRNYSGSIAATTSAEDAENCDGNQLERAANQLAARLKRHASCRVLYVRGDTILELAAAFGRTQQLIDSESLPANVQPRDFLIPTTDLAADFTLPVTGDQIREINGLVYEVLPHGTEPCFRYADPFRRILRIHTKHVGSV